jgi:hypothetical protein
VEACDAATFGTLFVEACDAATFGTCSRVCDAATFGTLFVAACEAATFGTLLVGRAMLWSSDARAEPARS